VALSVAAIEHPTPDVLKLTLTPVTPGECFCEFTPGQYVELWQPAATYLSRAYSIANAPHGDGSIVLHIRRVDGGRFTAWAFDGMKLGDRLQARGPLGAFTMRTPAGVPLLFVAGGTGFAPVLALLEQQAKLDPARDLLLVWGMQDAGQFYALDELSSLLGRASGLRVVLAAQQGQLQSQERVRVVPGTVVDALAAEGLAMPGRDVYAAGPPAMLRALAAWLPGQGVEAARTHFDTFGT
jgi:CDP-4-dehydro-6-deoxyglucose reductase, E3